MRYGLLLLVSLTVLFAETISFETTYKAAMEKAIAQDKVLMVVVTQTYCPWCDKFKHKTLVDKEVIKKVNENFVAVLLNKDKDDMPEDIRARMVPTTFFLDHEGGEIFSTIGYKHPRKFLMDIKDAIELSAEMQGDGQ